MMKTKDKSKQQFYRNQAGTIIRNAEKRNISAYYCDSNEEARQQVLTLVDRLTSEKGLKSTVMWGGSQTIRETGITEALFEKGYHIPDREKAASPAEAEEICRKAFSADVYLMSSNAVTLRGELVNIDGSGNRLAALIYGPRHVIVVAGMNKIVPDTQAGITRVQNFASPPNTTRLSIDTPCQKLGICGNCLEQTICCQIVITRASRHPNRIHLVLVGEELGF